MGTPISHIASRTVGVVESVAPDEIRVLLDVDSPRSTALTGGTPYPFPRLNGYVLIPSESGAVVGVVTWIGVERSAYPKRKGFQDFGLIDLPFPLRKMSICPMGTLCARDDDTWDLKRGVQQFPSVGDSAILPTSAQLRAIVTGEGPNSRMRIGTCPGAHDAPISVNPDKLFGRHVAVLGNTGSGKSCTVAGIIRSAVESAEEASEVDSLPPNARFIVLDPNGEYSKCFDELGSGCNVFKIPPLGDQEGVEPFKLPAWMWNSSEWAAIAKAAPGVQRPILQAALRELRTGTSHCGSSDWEGRSWICLRTILSFLRGFRFTGAADFADRMTCGKFLKSVSSDLSHYLEKIEDGPKLCSDLENLIELMDDVVSSSESGQYYDPFSSKDLDDIYSACQSILQKFTSDMEVTCVNEDVPVPFSVSQLASHIEIVSSHESTNANQYIATMILRIKSMVSDTRISEVVNPEDDIALDQWLMNTIGGTDAADPQVTVIDLSLVPYEILHTVIAVTSRLILEAHQRYRKKTGRNLPTTLVLEEAHTFVSRRNRYGDDIPTPFEMCKSTFERIAREGRKFGLGLLLSSQRPSELSETVLSQCNSFLLHRITNDRDQELISRLVPDTNRGLLRELPSLPTSHYVLLGLAAKIPVLVEARMLDEDHRPESDDPDFWDVWTHATERQVDWTEIVEDWVSEKAVCELTKEEEDE